MASGLQLSGNLSSHWQGQEGAHGEETEEETGEETEEEEESRPDCWRRNSVHQEAAEVETVLRCHLN